ncbi:MAG: AI-2E family transporter, partial [Firmicutes bacterium]|nr:AI-2E family transporter [Bacillota bacterium]
YLTILYFIIFAFRNFSEPKIMGDSVGLHPLIMILAIYGGIVFFGVTGIVAGPVIAIIIRATTASGLFKWPLYSEE